MTPVLSVSRLSRRFGDFEALREASLEVSAGEFVAVPGPSGSGKSTLFRCISGLTEPDSGSILIEGVPFGGVAGASLRKARGGIGVVFQQFNLVRRRSAPANVLTSVLPSIPVWRIAMGA
ncbi:MAG: ATP-binding cassette domain-containing protein [Methylobacterium sp.]|nr:ATP-binding cassette domain-containing protein [Methylobacterium sp.]